MTHGVVYLDGERRARDVHARVMGVLGDSIPWLDVVMHDDTAVLRGVVTTDAVREAAVALASIVPEVGWVVDELGVVGRKGRSAGGRAPTAEPADAR